MHLGSYITAACVYFRSSYTDDTLKDVYLGVQWYNFIYKNLLGEFSEHLIRMQKHGITTTKEKTPFITYPEHTYYELHAPENIIIDSHFKLNLNQLCLC